MFKNYFTRLALLISSFYTIIISPVFSGEKSIYDFSWLDNDKEIYVLQNRKFRKDDKLYFSLNGIKTMSGAFIDSYGLNVRTGFFFSENWGVEGIFGRSSGSKNTTAKGVEAQQSNAFYRKVDTYMGGMLMWSPFYSKINTFNKIFYYDWMFGLGLASVKTLDNRGVFQTVPSDTLTSENSLGAIWNTGIRIYLTETWSLRADFNGIHAKPKKASGNSLKTDSLFSNYDFSLGLNYTF